MLHSQTGKKTNIHNNNCDGDWCASNYGPVKIYPLGGSGNLILCHACWAHENKFRYHRGKETKEPDNWPQHNWYAAELYTNI